MHQDSAFLCSICFQRINVNNCKFDEAGRPVHQECLATRDLYGRVPKRTAKKIEWRSLWQKPKAS